MNVLPRASRARLKYFGSTVDHLLPESQPVPRNLDLTAAPERTTLRSLSPHAMGFNLPQIPKTTSASQMAETFPSHQATTARQLPSPLDPNVTDGNMVSKDTGSPKNYMGGHLIPRSDGDDRSSSLSDIEDRPGNELVENNHVEFPQGPEGDDTEAETERLEESPQKLRKQKHVILSSSKRHDIERATSLVQSGIESKDKTLQQVGLANASGLGDDILELDQIDQMSEISSLGDSATETSRPTSPIKQGIKRKRPTRDHVESDLDATAESLKKVAAHLEKHVNHGADSLDVVGGRTEDYELSDTGASRAISQSLRVSKVNLDKRLTQERNVNVFAAGALGQPKQTLLADDTLIEDADAVDAALSNGEDAEVGDDDGTAANVAARNEEEFNKKRTALDALSAIERLFDDRLAQYNEELAQLNHPNPNHPDYLAMMECIDQRRNEKIEHEHILLHYKLQALERTSVGERAQHHSQYVQTVRDIRDRTLEQANKEWYQIQRERRNWDGDLPEYMYMFPTRRSHQIAQQTAYNAEVSILSGIAKYVGFPAAPEICGAPSSDIDDDLRSMGITPQPQTAQQFQPSNPRANPSVSNLPRQRLPAEEQFFEQTPWANPQHPAHQQILNTVVHRRISHHSRPHSPFVTPAAQRRNIYETQANGLTSTVADLHSTQDSSMAASVVPRFTTHLGDIIPHTPSKSNGVGTPELGSEAHGIIATPNNGDSAQVLTIETAAAATTADPASEKPHQILSPPRKAQAPILQAFESPGGFPLSTYNFAGRQFEESSDQHRRSGASVQAHIPEQVGVVSGTNSVK
ncbi:MAG: hypothetical protein Q9187_001187 [Circinaria calcarea]